MQSPIPRLVLSGFLWPLHCIAAPLYTRPKVGGEKQAGSAVLSVPAVLIVIQSIRLSARSVATRPAQHSWPDVNPVFVGGLGDKTSLPRPPIHWLGI